MSRVRMNNIVKKFGDIIAVNDVSLDIPDGKFVILVGPSGCGKTTLLRQLAGLEAVTSGEIYIGERNVTNLHPRERDIAMVFQSYALYPHMSVRKNMAFSLNLKKIPKAEVEARVSGAAEILGITALLDRQPKQLSGGQRQRVAVGRAIVRQPEVFLFDEPLSNLDAKMRNSMRGELIKLHKQLGSTIVYVTHDQVEAMTMGQIVVVMNAGVVQQVGEPLDIYKNPKNVFVAGFVGSPAMNFWRGKVDCNTGLFGAQNGSMSFALEAGALEDIRRDRIDDVIIGIRPEHLRLLSAGDDRGGGVTIEGVVELIESLGAETVLSLNCGGNNITARLMDETNLRMGQQVRFVAELSKVLLFDAKTEKRIGYRASGIQ